MRRLHTAAKSTTLHVLCMVCLSMLRLVPCLASPQATTKTSKAPAALHKRSVLSLSLQKQVVTTSPTTYLQNNPLIQHVAQKLLLWKRTTPDQVSLGFGIAGDAITAGSLASHGFLRVLEDASKTRAWSYSLYERIRWTLQHASTTMPLGIALHLQQPWLDLSAWTRLSNVRAPHALRSTGLATTITAGAHKTYKASFLYQYSMRTSLKTSKTAAQSWYVRLPTSLELHSVATRHEITTPVVHAQLAAKLSLPDTLPMGWGASALLRLSPKPFSLALFAQGASPDYLSSQMEHQRTLWSHSTELTLSYALISFLRLRYNIDYRNPMTELSAAQRGIDKTIHQQYYLSWKQELPSTHSAHYLLLRYEFASQYARHKALLHYGLTYKSLDMAGSITTQYTHQKQKGHSIVNAPLKHIHLIIGATLTKNDILPHLSTFMRLQTNMRVYTNTAGKKKPKSQIMQELTFTMGGTLRIKPALLRVSFPFVYKANGNVSTSVTFSLHYTID